MRDSGFRASNFYGFGFQAVSGVQGLVLCVALWASECHFQSYMAVEGVGL